MKAGLSIMPTLLQAAILGVIQGLTEFLPVSSTAHLLIGERLLGFQDPGGVFTVMIQLGSVLAVMWLYRRKISGVVAGLPASRDARRFALMILVAFIPAVLAGAVLAGYVKSVLYSSFGAIAAAFIVGGIVLLLIERFGPRPVIHDVDRISLPRAFAVGVCQTLALIPGVSRSGATIAAGMAVGFDRATAAEFSFFLAMPTMTAAFVHDLYEVKDYLSGERAAEIAVGLVMAFLASAAVVKPVLGFVKRSGFAPFAWYRIALGVALLAARAYF
jgi:undecaprenyl-diphosphatase